MLNLSIPSPHTQRIKLTLFLPISFSIQNWKKVSARSPEDSNRYVHLDDLKDTLDLSEPYELLELMDEVMGICADTTPDRVVQCRARSKFVADLGFPFPVGVFIYERHSSLGNWTSVF